MEEPGSELIARLRLKSQATAMINVDPLELDKFSQLAHRWWDPGSEFKPLHDINPLRLDYIDGIAALKGKRVLDVGCGGGILAEAMAARGARVTGIDLGEAPLKVAQLHLLESGLEVDYRLVEAEALAREMPGVFDVVTCMELLEHVPDPGAMVRACTALVRPGGQLFFSTINRNLKSYVFAVIGAEYVLNLLPRGTHDYARFIKPSELAAACRTAGLSVQGIVGMTYNPFTKVYALGSDADVNYILHALRS
jgi:2-polyprenyl-6-hydroxyphenyl methylase/3-demethylubiquinone-9 3-methyltransferase